MPEGRLFGVKNEDLGVKKADLDAWRQILG